MGLVIVAMTLVSGCGFPSVKPYPTPTFSADATSSSSAPGPVKYDPAVFKSCLEIQQKVPELPPPLQAGRRPQGGSGRFSLECEFTTSKDNDGRPYITFRVEFYDNQRDAYGFQSGAEIAKTGFDVNVPPGAEKETGVRFGSEARWTAPGASCFLQVLDENVVMIFSYNSGKKDNDPRSEQCREGARDIATKFYAAVQPA